MSNFGTSHTTLAIVDDGVAWGDGSGSGSTGTSDNLTDSYTINSTFHEDDTTTIDAGGATVTDDEDEDEDDETYTFSGDESGTDLGGPFSESSSGSGSSKATGIQDA